MCHAYNSVFTGCFCSCHFNSLCRNTHYQQNEMSSNLSQLSANALPNMQHQPGYPSFQSPPQNFLAASASDQMAFLPYSSSKQPNSSMQMDSHFSASQHEKPTSPSSAAQSH